jgi:hypothetical protein
LEYCNLGTAKRNPGPRRFDRGSVRHYRLCAPSRRIRMSVHEIANSGLTLAKLSVAASLLGDLMK